MMKIKAASKIPLTEKFALSIAEAAELSGTCRSVVYVAVSTGALRARKRGRSTLILPDDLRAWIAAFPDYTPSPANNPNPGVRTRPRVPAAAE